MFFCNLSLAAVDEEQNKQQTVDLYSLLLHVGQYFQQFSTSKHVRIYVYALPFILELNDFINIGS